jgi:hypothetical protein
MARRGHRNRDLDCLPLSARVHIELLPHDQCERDEATLDALCGRSTESTAGWNRRLIAYHLDHLGPARA